ncbi:hypothetical protein D1872_81720 [compost metagenome]
MKDLGLFKVRAKDEVIMVPLERVDGNVGVYYQGEKQQVVLITDHEYKEAVPAFELMNSH